MIQALMIPTGHSCTGRRTWHRRVDPREVRPHRERENPHDLHRDDHRLSSAILVKRLFGVSMLCGWRQPE
jgi:hypothetical protein